jgi:hypothetical protein
VEKYMSLSDVKFKDLINQKNEVKKIV